MSAKLLFHPSLPAQRAAEIARSQGATRLERDACGRPFVRGADPLAEAPTETPVETAGIHCAWLIRIMHALGREAGPPMSRPGAITPPAPPGRVMEKSPTHPPPLGAGEEIR